MPTDTGPNEDTGTAKRRSARRSPQATGRLRKALDVEDEDRRGITSRIGIGAGVSHNAP